MSNPTKAGSSITGSSMMWSPDVKVRDYRPADLQACLTLFDSNVPRFFTAEEREEFASFLTNLPGPYLVVLAPNGDIVGCGGFAYREGGAVADLCWGMVHHDLHGKGHGHFLTKTRIDRASEDPSVQELALNTSQLTVGFYEGLGFKITEVMENGYGPGLDRCEMRLEVANPGA